MRRRIRLSLETILHKFILLETIMLSDEHKSYHLLDRATKKIVHQPCRPSLHQCKTLYYKKAFKSADETCTSIVERLNYTIKN